MTGGMGSSVRFVRNGAPLDAVLVDADPFETTLDVDAPYGDAEDRWRAEVVRARDLRVVTSHLYVTPQPGSPPDAGPTPSDAGGAGDAGSGPGVSGGGCGCRLRGEPASPLAPWALGLAIALLSRRRRGA